MCLYNLQTRCAAFYESVWSHLISSKDVDITKKKGKVRYKKLTKYSKICKTQIPNEILSATLTSI